MVDIHLIGDGRLALANKLEGYSMQEDLLLTKLVYLDSKRRRACWINDCKERQVEYLYCTHRQ